MKLRRFNKNKHFDILIDWLTQHGCFHPTLEETPKNGYIAYEGDTPVAIAFLRFVEGGFAQLDGLTTNPAASSENRNLGIECVVTMLISKAREYGIKSITAYSRDLGTIVRSQSHGFVEVSHKVLVANLNDHINLC